MFSKSVIVVPWDFSALAQCALTFALKRTLPANIRVVCVMEKPDPYRIGLILEPHEKEVAQNECESEFWDKTGLSRSSGLRFDAVFGDPATEIVCFAETVEAELILIPTHGRAGIKRLVLGSVAQKISQIAACPVLLLPGASLDVEGNRDSKTAIASE